MVERCRCHPFYDTDHRVCCQSNLCKPLDGFRHARRYADATLPLLENKTIVITGCTSGTGLVVAKTCVEKGAESVVMLNRESDRATQAEADVNALANETRARPTKTIGKC